MARLSYGRAVSALKAGDRVMVTLPDPTRASDRTTYSMLGGGYLTPTTWRKLEPSLRPVRDGLFPDGLSQTYAWAG